MKTGSTEGRTVLPPNSKLVAGYWPMWQGPHVSEITANAPQYNLQYAAFAMGNRAGSGSVAFDPVFSSPQRLEADIADSKAHGASWLLSIGGGSDSTTKLLNETHANEMVSSLIPIIDSYGFQGVDFDLEQGSGQWVPAAMTSAAVQLKAHYGTGFLISAAPRPFEDAYRTFAVQAGAALDLFGYQFYDFPEANDTTSLRNIIASRIHEAVHLGIPASKLMVGCITYSAYQNGHNAVQNYRDIFKQLEARYPALRGVYVWETSLDKLESWSFARVMGPSIRGVP
jgi:chitinase